MWPTRRIVALTQIAPDMEHDRLVALLDDVDEDRHRGNDVGLRLCGACVEVLDVSGAGVMLMTDGAHGGTLAVSDGVSTILEELQFTLGEGPCIDAWQSQQPVLEPDLVDPAAKRWPAFAGPAIDAGARAVFGFPLTSGTTCLGALELYLDHPGDLRPAQVSDAAVMADVISTAVLSLQADAPAGELAHELGTVLDRRAVVHQAAGMVSAKLDIAVRDALVRIRARSYLDSRPVNEVARDVVQRRLRFD